MQLYLSQEDGDGDDELVHSADSSSQRLGGNLRKIHGGQTSVQTRVNTDQQTTYKLNKNDDIHN